MRVLRLIPMFVLFLLLGGQVMFLPGEAYALCCMCGMCNPARCTCPGVGNCSWCRMGDSDTFRSGAPTGDGTLDIRAVRGPLPSIVVKSDVTERLMELTRGGKRLGSTFMLKMLGSIADGLKFACPGSAGKNMQANKLAFQMEVNKEK